MSSLSVLPISTLMHALMSVDPDARALRFWEVMRPSPPPGTSAEDDPRRALADADWREINAKMPKWLHCHPYHDMPGDENGRAHVQTPVPKPQLGFRLLLANKKNK